MRKKTENKEVVKVHTHELTVVQLDELGLRLAGLPVSNKDKEIFAAMLIDELGISDGPRFLEKVHEVDVPTPKT